MLPEPQTSPLPLVEVVTARGWPTDAKPAGAPGTLERIAAGSGGRALGAIDRLPADLPFDPPRVVRVELPRSALESFGLPMNMERAGERIKADVVVGHDGLARAIRFVR